jgi:hypothetical protein
MSSTNASSRRALRKQKQMLPYERLEFMLNEGSAKYGSSAEEGAAIGYMIVQPVDMEELASDDNESGNNNPPSKAALKGLTQAQVDCFRCVFMPNDRADAVEEMEKLILGEQYGQRMMMFGTYFANQVAEAYNGRFKILMARAAHQNRPATTLNLLFGLTFALREYDTWMNDFEVGFVTEYGSKMIKSLAAYWKHLLTNVSAADMGILEDFTLPGIHAYLAQFKSIVEDIDTYDEAAYEFNYA